MNPPCNEWASTFFDGIMTAEAVAADNTITYQDSSTYIEDGGRLEKHKKSERNFPARLHAMLSDEQHSHIISWMPHGRAFKVLDKKLLVEEAIPKYFGQSKYPSFTRQLSGWGFTRLHQTGRDFGCYYHECFLRGHPRLTILMRRIPSGSGQDKATRRNTRAEPDFYAIAEQFPLHATGEEPVYSPTFEDKKKEEEDYETKAKESNDFHEVMTSFDPLPVSNHNNLDSIASWASTSRCETSVSQFQFHVKNGSHQYFGKNEDETGSEHIMYTPAPVFSPVFSRHYHGATGNLYRNVQDQGGQGLAQPQTAMIAAPICMGMEDGLCATDGASCYGSAVGHPVQHTYPHFQGAYHDPLVFNNRSNLGYVSMNLDSQLQSNDDYHPKGQDQPTHRSIHNPWIAPAVTEDPLKQMSMSIPDQAFDFNSSSLEDSFCNSPVDPTTTFLE